MANFKISAPENSNYCGIVCSIDTIVHLENCDNLAHAIIFGNRVIVTKDVVVGTVGIYFPCGAKMSEEYLRLNNMFSEKELNEDKTKKGYFGKNGLVRCVKLRGNASEGLFVGMDTLAHFLNKGNELCVGDMFDTINGHVICSKYIPPVKVSNSPGFKNSKNDKRLKRVSRLVENQFHFHIDTQMLYRNLDKFSLNDLISITYKIHGTSGISANILCKKDKLTIKDWIRKIITREDILEYTNIFSSRKVIKNEFFSNGNLGYYGEDIWSIANEELKPFLKKGMTIYYEIAGYMPSGAEIQKGYDYGCESTNHKIYIYRITYTNVDGDVYEFSMKQVQDFCKERGLTAVPLLYYGTVGDFLAYKGNIDISCMSDHDIRKNFLELLKTSYNEKDCYICRNTVPEEGCVIRKEINGIESYKVKSTRFYERETIELESGMSNIEDNN